MVIGLLILTPVIAIITGYFTLKGYQLGLKHNYELKHDSKPTIAAPIKEFFETKVNAKTDQEQTDILNEWLNGGD